MPRHVFLLSPANCSGKRAGHLLRDGGASALAARLRSGEGATIGEVFTFMSGLYFRGKLAYAAAFAREPADVQVIVPGLGLRRPDDPVDLEAVRAIARVPVDPASPRYVRPLARDAAALARRLGPSDGAVLLGSVATAKYLDPLGRALGARLLCPREFIGRGAMSRGSLLLRRADEGRELKYVEAVAATGADASLPSDRLRRVDPARAAGG